MEIFVYLAPVVVFFLCFVLTPEVIFCIAAPLFLLFVPSFVKLELPLFPDVSLLNACLIVILIALFIKNISVIKFKKIDFVVLLFSATIGYSQYKSNYSDIWTNVFGNSVINFFVPYILCRNIFSNQKYFLIFVRSLAFFGGLLVVVEFWEAKMSLSPFTQIFGVFTEEVERTSLIGRFGLVRVRGPFIHPIVAAQILSVVFLLYFFLTKSKIFTKAALSFSSIPFNSVLIFYLMLILGALLPVSRWPIYSLILVVSAFYILRTRMFSFKNFVSLLSFTIFLFLGFWYLSNITEEKSDVEIVTQLESSALTRERVFEQALSSEAVKNKLWGNGFNPDEKKQHGTLSLLDNEYLSLYLHRGLINLSFYILIIAMQCVRLFIRFRQTKSKYPDESLVILTLLLGIMFMSIALWNSTAVDMTEFMLWALIGSSEAFLGKKPGDFQNSDFVKKYESKKIKKLGSAVPAIQRHKYPETHSKTGS